MLPAPPSPPFTTPTPSTLATTRYVPALRSPRSLPCVPSPSLPLPLAQIVAGGSAPCVQHWSPNGELRYATQVAVSSIYAVASSPAASLTAVSGLGPAIDMLANPRVRAFSLSLLDSDTE